MHEKNTEYYEHVRDILDHSNFKSMDGFIQHGKVSCADHSKAVSYTSYKLCKKLRLDHKSAARAGLLHDYFLYDWHKFVSFSRFHAFTHPKVSLKNAEKDFELNDRERDIIKKHMWPMTPSFPKYPESYVVTMVDKYYSTLEIFGKKYK